AEQLVGDDTDAKIFIPMAFQALESDVVRKAILDTGKRIDGRDTKTVRPILCEPGILPKAHGSVLFTRGETQALVVATLGTGTDEQRVETLDGDTTVNFMLHYNFLPFSVGEVKRIGSPGRREIGHGKLAWRAIRPMLPAEYPYTLRIVSEIMESNGSSSMATVCGASLALMDAGVPIKKPVAGIAMGLIKEGEKFSVLTDILGDEDSLGDMDFKVAGTVDGVTALQMDLKITSITKEIMDIALKQAKEGRLHILGEMDKALSEARDELSPNAPRITTMQIDKDKIREVIGTGGKVIREIVEVSGAKIDVDDNGLIKIFAVSGESCEKAHKMITNILAVAEPGKIYQGKVVKLMEFGVFVNFIGNSDGLVHISELSNMRVENAEAVVSEGDVVWVKCLDVDPRGKVRLSMKRVDQETGQDLDPNNEIEVIKPKPRERSRDRDRGDRGDRGDRDRRPRRREE
ncbi:MAG: polyribonucleotide nucleotidyltransferase, partial [Alphaproteobacteria bacterium]|nr:polyribonucleotide nucleotidyltransferase [Alphaproteobacteria bacterium]